MYVCVCVCLYIDGYLQSLYMSVCVYHIQIIIFPSCLLFSSLQPLMLVCGDKGGMLQLINLGWIDKPQIVETAAISLRRTKVWLMYMCVYVCCICMLYMYVVYVCCICMLYMFVVYVCVCMCMYVYVCVCMCMYVYVCQYVYVCVGMCRYAEYVCARVCMYMYLFVCMRMYLYVSICIYMYLYVAQ